MSTVPAMAPTAQRPVAGVLAATGGVVLWGGLVPVAKAAEEVNGIDLGFHRLWIGAVAVVIILYATGGRLHRETLRTSFWGGALFGLDIVLFFSAIKLTTVANATRAERGTWRCVRMATRSVVTLP